MVDDDVLRVYGYVLSSSYRRSKSDKIPTELAHDIGIRSNHISKVLHELKDCGVAECINEEKRKNRIYRLTPKGESIAKLIE